jgi:hypothetical protein
MPDFVIQDPKTQKVHFIEVKFRSDENFSIKDIEKNYPYPNSYFIIVSKKHIKCLTYEALKDGKKITPTSDNFLGELEEFSEYKDVIIEFCQFATKFFECI